MKSVWEESDLDRDLLYKAAMHQSLTFAFICTVFTLMSPMALAATVTFSYEEVLKWTWKHEGLNLLV